MASTQIVERRPRTLKHGQTFAQFDHCGDIGEDHANPEGIFFNDTRHLSRSILTLNGERPLLLASSVSQGDTVLTVDLTNTDYFVDGQLVIPGDVIHLRRTKFLWGGTCHEQISVSNFSLSEQQVVLRLHFDGDFRDVFEVRGHRRGVRGKTQIARVSDDEVIISYRALDQQLAQTMLRFEPEPTKLEAGFAEFSLMLAPQTRKRIYVETRCTGERETQTPKHCFYLNLREDRRWRRMIRSRAAVVESSDALLDELVQRSISDTYMLVTDTDWGPYPFAGIPWYSTVFGRDGIITALQLLWFDPEIARGVLNYLAASQATVEDLSREAEPGKILHETRMGEMARLGEIPFAQYYGTVDATPLFVVLAGEYLRRTGDIKTIRRLWPNIEAALNWIDTYGDIDGDGFVEYESHNKRGLTNQGWKDSHDSVFHADGSMATGAIALCEVQGYVYAAKRSAARMANAMGLSTVSATLVTQAEVLRARFEQAFWCEELSTYALALDGNNQPCRVRTSNAGHALYTGIASPERARRVADTLLDMQHFSGWGIRTVASTERRYNPMSYHNGSVWPHDNSLIALGFARYGLKSHALKLFRGLSDAASHTDLRRLPELFCGFVRREHAGPTFYPTACAPQAWASGSFFALLQACLGLNLDQRNNEIKFHQPVLPHFIEELRLRDLKLGDNHVDVTLRNHAGSMTVDVVRRTGDVRVLVLH